MHMNGRPIADLILAVHPTPQTKRDRMMDKYPYQYNPPREQTDPNMDTDFYRIFKLYNEQLERMNGLGMPLFI